MDYRHKPPRRGQFGTHSGPIAESGLSPSGQYLPEAGLLLIAAKTRRERLGGNVTRRKAVIRETARRSSISPDH
jgi:hypothetical protein